MHSFVGLFFLNSFMKFQLKTFVYEMKVKIEDNSELSAHKETIKFHLKVRKDESDKSKSFAISENRTP